MIIGGKLRLKNQKGSAHPLLGKRVHREKKEVEQETTNIEEVKKTTQVSLQQQ